MTPCCTMVFMALHRTPNCHDPRVEEACLRCYWLRRDGAGRGDAEEGGERHRQRTGRNRRCAGANREGRQKHHRELEINEHEEGHRSPVAEPRRATMARWESTAAAPRCYLKFARRCSPRRRWSPPRPSAAAPGEQPLAPVEPPCAEGPSSRALAGEQPRRWPRAPRPAMSGGQGHGAPRQGAGLPRHGRGPVPPRPTAPRHGCLAAVSGHLRRRRAREGG